jgi:hypothetical protein
MCHLKPTNLPGVLQQAAHTRLTEASRPNKGVENYINNLKKVQIQV